MNSLWRCTICGYVHTGSEPPESCPICAAGPEYFEQTGVADSSVVGLQEVLLKVPCGLFVVTSVHEGRPNGMVNNTVFQITDAPLQVLLGMDKRHLTTEYLEKSNVFAVNMLTLADLKLVKKFGFKSGRELDKFAGIDWTPGVTGAPLLKTAGHFEARIKSKLDAGTHTVFLAEVVQGMVQPEAAILTYQEYREHKQELWEQINE